MRRSIFANILVFSQSILLSQFSFNGNSQLRYGESENGYIYSESLINTNLRFGNFTTWMQFEFSDPPELGRSFSGLRKIRLEYQRGPIEMILGDIYSIWGRGLLLNQFDNQGIDIDNGLTGLNLQFSNDRYNFNLLYGKADIWKLDTGEDRIPSYESNHNVLASELELFVKNFTIGTSFLHSEELHPIKYYNESFILTGDTLKLIHKLKNFRVEYPGDWFDIYGEYVDKKVSHDYDGVDSLANSGYGFFGNVNLYFEDWSFSFDYKRYNFLQLSPNPSGDLGVFSINYGGVIDFQVPPISMREHSSTLLGRITHQVDFNDELGYQVEGIGPIKDWFTLLLNYSQSSRNYLWNGYRNHWSTKAKTSLFPFTDPSANTFQEVYSEIEGYGFDGNLHYQIGAGFTKDIPNLAINYQTDSTHRLEYEFIKGITFPMNFDLVLSDGWSIEIKLEYQQLTKGKWVYFEQNGYVEADSLLPNAFQDSKEKQFNSFINIGIGKSPKWSLSLIIDAASVEEVGIETGSIEENMINPLEELMSHIMEIDKKWLSLELAYNITPTHRLSLMYGSQRGGLVCSNGICRIIPPFNDGFRINLTSMF